MPIIIRERGIRRNRGYKGFVDGNKGVISEDAYGIFLSDIANLGFRYYIKDGDILRIPKQNYARPGFRVYQYDVRLDLPSNRTSRARVA